MKRAFVLSLILHLGVLSGLLWWWSGRDEPRLFSVHTAVRASDPDRPDPVAAPPQTPKLSGQAANSLPAAPSPSQASSGELRSVPFEPAPEPVAQTPELPSAPEARTASMAGEIKPAYPREARRRNWEGVVEVLVEVGEDGQWRGGRVTASSGHSLLDEAALQALKGAVFHPALRGGVPEPGTLTARIIFQLKSD